MSYLELPTNRRRLWRYGGVGELTTKRRGLWRYGGLGADDPMIFCCPNDTIRHPASYCKTVVCEKPLSRALPGPDDMMYCCPGDTVMRPKSRCRTIECAGAPAAMPAPSMPAAAPIMTPPVEPTAEEPVYYALPVADTSDLDARRAALAERQADIAARMEALRAGAPAGPKAKLGPAAKPPAGKGPPALSISAPQSNVLLIAAAIGGGLLLLNYFKKGK